MTDNKDTTKFYDDAMSYWSKIDPSINGMLGGFAHISSTDIAGSSKFLINFIKGTNSINVNRALDCGAGIGRITKRLLLPLFKDMVEFNEKFLDQSEEYIGKQLNERVGSKFCTPLQCFTPDNNHYNLIWIQWVLGHLTEPDFIEFFRRCKKGLSDKGLICVKENTAPNETPIFDSVDSSYTRSYDSMIRLFTAAGLNVIMKQKQTGFPKDIYDVWIFALQ